MNPVSLFKCLADETRLKSLLLINEEQELCVCELMAALNLSQPKVSRHLALLRKEGLLIDNKQAQWVFYRINPELADWITQTMSATAEQNQTFIKDELTNLHKMGERPQRQSKCC